MPVKTCWKTGKRSPRAPLGKLFGRATRHGGGPAAGRDEPHAHLHQADVGLQEGLGSIRGQHELRAATQRSSSWGHHDRDGGVADGGRRGLERVDGALQLVPLALLGLDQHEGQVRAGGEVRGVRADHQPVIAVHGQLHGPPHHGDRLGADDVQLAVQLQAQDAVRQLQHRCGRRRRKAGAGGALPCGRQVERSRACGHGPQLAVGEAPAGAVGVVRDRSRRRRPRRGGRRAFPCRARRAAAAVPAPSRIPSAWRRRCCGRHPRSAAPWRRHSPGWR